MINELLRNAVTISLLSYIGLRVALSVILRNEGEKMRDSKTYESVSLGNLIVLEYNVLFQPSKLPLKDKLKNMYMFYRISIILTIIFSIWYFNETTAIFNFGFLELVYSFKEFLFIFLTCLPSGLLMFSRRNKLARELYQAHNELYKKFSYKDKLGESNAMITKLDVAVWNQPELFQTDTRLHRMRLSLKFAHVLCLICLFGSLIASVFLF